MLQFALHTEKRDMRMKYRILAFLTLHIQRKGAFCSTDKGLVRLPAENKTLDRILRVKTAGY
jgi:hypothetical protein